MLENIDENYDRDCECEFCRLTFDEFVAPLFAESNGTNWWHHDYRQWPETKCPDLGDWSEVPHDQLDKLMHPWEIMVINARIRLDRERLLSYIED